MFARPGLFLGSASTAETKGFGRLWEVPLSIMIHKHVLTADRTVAIVAYTPLYPLVDLILLCS